MLWISLLVAFGLACAVAAWFVAREAGRLSVEPPPPVFDTDEAYDWVVAHLPDIVAATLTSGDVRRILDFQVEYLERQGVAGNGSSHRTPTDVVIGAPDAVDYICARASETGEAYLPEQVHGVLETQLDYLRAIGAVGSAVVPDDETDAP